MRPLLLAWAALMALLASTVAISYVPLGAFNLVLALAIAAAKTLIVMSIFMKLRHGSPLTRIFAGAGFFWLMILLVLAGTDYLTRAPWTTP